jgi:hypothetical protein
MNDYDEGPRARAITWEEWKRNGGGGGGPGGPDREPSWLGQKFRDWAQKLIQKEQNSLDQPAQTPAQYVAAQKKQRELTREFNALNEPDFGTTLNAIGTIVRYTFSTPAVPQQT